MNAPLMNAIALLEAHLLGLREEGVRTLEVSRPLRSLPARAAAAASPVPQPPPPPPATASATPPSAPAPPPPPPAETLRTAAVAEKHLVALVARDPRCRDSTPTADTVLAVVCAPEEFAGDHRVLLSRMLGAIGYALPEAACPEPLETAGNLRERAARVLCFGETAQQALSPMKLPLNLVRGKWQATPSGRMMALYPPSYLHNNTAGKRSVWTDLQQVLRDLGLELPASEG